MERKKSSVRTVKIIRKKYFAIYNRKIFKEFIYLHNLGNYLDKKWSRNLYRRKFIQYHNRGINVFEFFWGDGGLYCRQWVLC